MDNLAEKVIEVFNGREVISNNGKTFKDIGEPIENLKK